MLLRKVSAKNIQGSLLEMPLFDNPGVLVVKDIQGLGPVKATLVSSNFANQDGAQYHSSRREPRNIVITLGLAPDLATMSVYDLRDQLYEWFMPKSEVVLIFEAYDRFSEQTLKVDILGHVETCEPNIFTQEPEVTISIMCFNPDFVNSFEPVVFDMETTDTMSETILSYSGTIDTGVLFTIRPNRVMDGFTILHRLPSGELHQVSYTHPSEYGDVIEISSVQGSKYAKRWRIGVEESVLYAITPSSDWLRLQPGSNAFRVFVAGEPVPVDISYTAKYGGL